MNDVLTYIEWRGDLSFSQSGFNEVDNLIFSLLSYFDFKDILPKPGEGELTLERASQLFFQGGDVPSRPSEASNSGKTLQWMLYAMANCRRYRKLKLASAVDVFNKEKVTQFYAICIHINRNRAYLSFRGTADDLAGWKEDFLLACIPEIPSQREALNYLEQIAALYPEKTFMLGGHSKGGNLAVYAAANAPEELQKRIVAVWSNDGPGFQNETLLSEGYQRIAHAVHHIVPKSSVVGMLLAHDEHYKIVDSSQVGLLQHDGFSWTVSGNHFNELEELTTQSVKADRAISKWLQGLSLEERRQFVDCLFDVLYASGATTLSEVRRDKLKALTASLPRVKEIPKDNRERIIEFLVLLRQIIRRLSIESKLDRIKKH
jgi:hypothetical protein